MTGFVFQDEYLERLAKLSDQEVGRLVRALAEYHATGKAQELAGRESIAFDFIKVDIDRIEQKYEAKCETNRNNRQRSSTTDDDGQRNTTNDPKDKDKVKDKIVVVNNNNRDHVREKAKIQLELFNRFWAAYPRKTAKQDAVKAFGKLGATEELLATMLSAIEKQKASNQWSDPQYIPHPATWLNGHRWEDEIVKGSPKGVAQTNYDQREYEEPEVGHIPDFIRDMMEEEAG